MKVYTTKTSNGWKGFCSSDEFAVEATGKSQAEASQNVVAAACEMYRKMHPLTPSPEPAPYAKPRKKTRSKKVSKKRKRA